MRNGGGRRKRVELRVPFLVLCVLGSGLGLLMLMSRPLDVRTSVAFPKASKKGSNLDSKHRVASKTCATVEEMGKPFKRALGKESLRVRRIIHNHFIVNGASRVRDLPPEQFCSHGFVLGKTAEAGFGNEMYKVLTAAALSVMLNRSLIIGKTRGKYPFGDYISYSNFTFTMEEIKHLWRHKRCESKYGKKLVMRIDDFMKPIETNVLCSNWKKWKQPIIWFQGTTDSMAAQFFLKNIHSEMRIVALDLFGDPKVPELRPNVFGELMRVLISPSQDVEAAVNWVIGAGENPHFSLHMRMLMNDRSIGAIQAALRCLRKVIQSQPLMSSRPKVVLVSDTPALVKRIKSNISEFAEVLHFDYEKFRGSIFKSLPTSDFRKKDWGVAPRWVAFVDFFLASRARHGAISGAHRRVGTTYAQLIAALAAAYNLGDKWSSSRFIFLSSFQSSLLSNGLKNQNGWGHVWSRYAGPQSCHNQGSQCAFTPILPFAWWDALWQSPLPRDIHRLASYGVPLSSLGAVDNSFLQNHCKKRKYLVRTIKFNL
ncbi:uncharacterized protein LOC113866895 [Abrus precatorius]|uniref:Uncharacterized protein LOC113866895 n=1 Tax=Abrus precatorius TaxID=3816 RepID=A0A8B8LRJ2_ABRPR|nr:uncharacterized protein LOC113866895 [Abrus precatorius]